MFYRPRNTESQRNPFCLSYNLITSFNICVNVSSFPQYLRKEQICHVILSNTDSSKAKLFGQNFNVFKLNRFETCRGSILHCEVSMSSNNFPSFTTRVFIDAAISARTSKKSQYKLKTDSVWMKNLCPTDTILMPWLSLTGNRVTLQNLKPDTGTFPARWSLPQTLPVPCSCDCLLTPSTAAMCTMTKSRHTSFTSFELELRYRTHTSPVKTQRGVKK